MIRYVTTLRDTGLHDNLLRATVDGMTVDDNELTGVERIGTNSGHGYAWSRPDGLRARCGGEALCAECRADAELVTAGMELIPGTGTMDDNELPGMWEHADFTGGDPDERSYAERERQQVKKTVGLIALERFIDNIGRYIETDEIDTDAWNEAVDNWCADLNKSAREGMKLLVRVALAAREWDKASNGLGSIFEAEPFAGLRRCVKALDEWERSL